MDETMVEAKAGEANTETPSVGASFKDLTKAVTEPQEKKVDEPKGEAPSQAMQNLKPVADLSGALDAAAKADPALAEELQALLAKAQQKKATETPAPTEAQPAQQEASAQPAAPEEPPKAATEPVLKKTKRAKKAKAAKESAPKKAKAPVEKKAKKAKATQTNGDATAKPSGGQSGPPLKLEVAQLNEKERKLLKAAAGITEQIEPKPIHELAEMAFPDADPVKANSWTRNSLRRLIRAKFMEKVGRGSYRIAKKGWAKVFDTAFPT